MSFPHPLDSREGLGRADGRPGDEDEGRMAQGIDEEEKAAVNDVPFLGHEGQQYGQDGDGAGGRNDAEKEPQQESAQKAPLGGPGGLSKSRASI